MASILSVTFDCHDPVRLAAFWRQALGYELEEQDEDGVSVRDTVGIGPVLYFQRVPEAKAVKNRVHLDLRAEDTMAGEVDRLVALGASVLQEHRLPHAVWTVMRDPEGNEFCLASGPGDAPA
jgi:predicted enzyme related to lactoylglutathione lyase